MKTSELIQKFETEKYNGGPQLTMGECEAVIRALRLIEAVKNACGGG